MPFVPRLGFDVLLNSATIIFELLSFVTITMSKNNKPIMIYL